MPNYFEFAYANLTHGYIYLFTNYCMALGIPIALGNFAVKPKWKCALIVIAEMAACLVVMELLAALYFTVFNSDRFVPFICGLIVTVLYALIRCKSKPFVRIMRASMYMGIGCLGITITMSMGALLGTPYYYLQWALICLNAVTVFFGAAFARFLSVKDNMRCHPMFTVAVAVIGGIYFLFAVFRSKFDFDPAASIAICVIFIFVYALVYFAIGYVVKKSYNDAYEQARTIMRSAGKDAFRLSNENIENMHKLRHEIKNHYAVMKTFIDEKEYDKLEKYFSEFSHTLEKTVEFADCGNDTLNAIIGIEQGRVQGIGAKLVYKIAVPPKLNVNDVDLCSLIMNLIDNSVEYYERSMRSRADNEILLEISLTNKTLLVNVVNDILPEHANEALSLKTSKANKNAHGYGSKVVASIVENYNGSISYEVKDGKFSACAILFCE